MFGGVHPKQKSNKNGLKRDFLDVLFLDSLGVTFEF